MWQSFSCVQHVTLFNHFKPIYLFYNLLCSLNLRFCFQKQALATAQGQPQIIVVNNQLIYRIPGETQHSIFFQIYSRSEIWFTEFSTLKVRNLELSCLQIHRAFSMTKGHRPVGLIFCGNFSLLARHLLIYALKFCVRWILLCCEMIGCWDHYSTNYSIPYWWKVIQSPGVESVNLPSYSSDQSPCA